MRVLYTTDGLPAADHAWKLLVALADRDRVEITVMSVTQTGWPAPEHLLVSLDPVEARRGDTVKIVDAAVEAFQKEGFQAVGRTGEGQPGEEIVRAVEDDWYDVTVMGAGSRSWLGQFLLGSVSTYVLHSSPSSVLIVHEAEPASPVRILLGTDGSRGSERAVRAIADLADPARCEVTVLSVASHVPPSLYPLPGGTPSLDPKARQAIEAEFQEQAQHNATRALEELLEAGLAAKEHVTVGHPTEQILKEAEAGAFDLVIVGSQGQGPVRRALLRSVSDQVVRHARATLVARRLAT